MRSSWRRSQTAFVGVILANLASLGTVWWYGWQAHALLLVYWLETGVVGAISVAKILRAEGSDDPSEIRSWTSINGERAKSYVGKSNREIATAFVQNYAGVWLFLGPFLLILPYAEDASLSMASPGVVAIAAVSLIGFHVVSYWDGYVASRAFERRGPVSVLVEPAPRFWALFLTIIFGLGATSFSQSPIGVIVVVAFFKCCADLLLHRRERKRALT